LLFSYSLAYLEGTFFKSDRFFVFSSGRILKFELVSISCRPKYWNLSHYTASQWNATRRYFYVIKLTVGYFLFKSKRFQGPASNAINTHDWWHSDKSKMCSEKNCFQAADYYFSRWKSWLRVDLRLNFKLKSL